MALGPIGLERRHFPCPMSDNCIKPDLVRLKHLRVITDAGLFEAQDAKELDNDLWRKYPPRDTVLADGAPKIRAKGHDGQLHSVWIRNDIRDDNGLLRKLDSILKRQERISKMQENRSKRRDINRT